MEHEGVTAKLSMGDFGRFVVSTRRGRVLASLFVAAAALFGLGLGVLHASTAVLLVAVIVFPAILVSVMLPQAIKATRSPLDGRQ